MASLLFRLDHAGQTGDGAVRVHVVKVAVGPLTEEEAAGIAEHGDFRPYATAIEKLANR